MRNRKIATLAVLAAGLCLLLSGCGTIDEDMLNTQANTSVEINMPYATATPLPANMSAPQAIVIDSEGNVTLNDSSVIEGDFRSVYDQAQRTAYRSLSLGNTGIAVQALQLRLKDLGYFNGAVSGLFDSETEAAVKRFEQTYGTMQTGVATAKLQLKLFASTAPAYGTAEYEAAVISQYQVLRPGTVGGLVSALQQRLKSLGYPITELTGVYDEQTSQCVRLFYAAYGLAASDIANVAMQRELYADTARPYNPSIQVMTTLSPEEEAQQAAITIPEDGGDIDESTAIALGNSGPRVSQVQKQLIALGYMDEGGATGVFDQATQEAVNRFLTAIGHTANGMLTQDMQDFLLSSRAPAYNGEVVAVVLKGLQQGDSGEDVMNLQRRLVELGYAEGSPNGKYGDNTINAVALYQKLNGHEVTGQASVALQAELFSSLALTREQAEAALNGPSEDSETTVDRTDTLFFNLMLGSSGSAVIALENRLVELGYLEMPSTVYDEATRDAVSAFQRAIGVPVTGEASGSLQRYIYSKAAPDASVNFAATGDSYDSLYLGDTGDEVTALQRRLWELGLLEREDIEDSVGTFNAATRQAVIDAQDRMGYTNADGVAGVEFQNFLFSRYGELLKDDDARGGNKRR